MASELTTSTLEAWNPQIVEWILECVDNAPESVINEITEIIYKQGRKTLFKHKYENADVESSKFMQMLLKRMNDEK